MNRRETHDIEETNGIRQPVATLAGLRPAPGERRPEVGMLLYPGLTLLDLLGPQSVLAHVANIHLVWKTTNEIKTDAGIALRPTTTFASCPQDLDVLFVGGGFGQLAVMQDTECLEFLADRGSRAKYVTSVCSGSLVLGAAGLLRGYQATCHWSAVDLLPLFGAVPVRQRVVRDRNRFTGGGVTAGIDFGLTLLAAIAGEEMARRTQLSMEYDPAPPYDCGSPEKAGPERTAAVLSWFGSMAEEMMSVCQSCGAAMPV